MAKAKKGETPEVKNKYVLLNEFDGVTTEAMHIRNIGVVVRERSKTAMSSTFLPGTKVKTKKGQKFIIIDKGPKPKKAKK